MRQLEIKSEINPVTLHPTKKRGSVSKRFCFQNPHTSVLNGKTTGTIIRLSPSKGSTHKGQNTSKCLNSHHGKHIVVHYHKYKLLNQNVST